MRGFTLLELMVVVALLVLGVTVAIPALGGMVDEARLSAATNRLLGGLSLARGEALRRGERVTLCRSADGMECGGSSSYAQGWLVFVDPAGTLQFTDLQQRLWVNSGEQVEMQANQPLQNYVSFVASGQSRYASGGFQAGRVTLCSAGGRARQVVVSATGRVRSHRVEQPGEVC